MSIDTQSAWLERHQIAVYAAAMAIGALAATALPGTQALSAAINPLLALMLFVTFLQVPLLALRQAWRDGRFLACLLMVNFVAVPALVWGLLPWLPDDPLVRVAALLVLLAPCIDYVVTFARLGDADAGALLAATPVLLVVQMLLLPGWLNLMLDGTVVATLPWEPFVAAFVWLILVPLGLAVAVQVWAGRSASGARTASLLGLLPVPATAVVLAVVVAAVLPLLAGQAAVWRALVPIYVVYALLAPLLGWGVARVFRLTPRRGRAVAFSAATRNSLVVLPLGLAIPGAMPVVPVVMVTQTLVELVAEVIYVRWLSRWGRVG